MPGTTNMKKKDIAHFIHAFVEDKYKGLIPFSRIYDAVIEFPDGRFGFNSHEVLERYGINLDQFKTDFSNLLTIFSRVDKV